MPAFSTWRTAFTIFSWGNLSGGKCRETNRVSHERVLPPQLLRYEKSRLRLVTGIRRIFGLPAQTQAGRSASSACTGPAAAQNISLPVKTPPKTDILPPEFSYAKASLLIPAPHLFCIIYWNLLHEEILTKLIVRACPGLFAMGQLLLCRQLPGAIGPPFWRKGCNTGSTSNFYSSPLSICQRLISSVHFPN